MINLFAKVGDIFVMLGIKNFPLQSFRLQNILTGYYVKDIRLEKITKKLPYDLNKSIEDFVKKIFNYLLFLLILCKFLSENL